MLAACRGKIGKYAREHAIRQLNGDLTSKKAAWNIGRREYFIVWATDAYQRFQTMIEPD